jgi:hypothetical protein
MALRAKTEQRRRFDEEKKLFLAIIFFTFAAENLARDIDGTPWPRIFFLGVKALNFKQLKKIHFVALCANAL